MAEAEDMPAPLAHCVQVAYATTDLDRAKGLFRDLYGVEKWLDLGRPEAGGALIETREGKRIVLRGAVAYVGQVQFELLEPVEDPDRLFLDFLPQDGSFAIRFHHLGFNHAERADVAALEGRMAATHPIALATNSPVVPVFYADARETLGHYLEYVSLPAAFDATIPRN